MLNVFRENLKSLKWLLWVVAASMTLYLGAFFTDSCGGVTGTWAARVNGAVIPRQDLYNRTRELDRQYQQIFGQNYTQMRPSLQLHAAPPTAGSHSPRSPPRPPLGSWRRPGAQSTRPADRAVPRPG